MNQTLAQIEQSIMQRLSSLEERESELESSLAKVQEEKRQMQPAIERIKALSSGAIKLGQFGCVNCYVMHGTRTELRPISSDKPHVDYFRCRDCGSEIVLRS